MRGCTCRGPLLCLRCASLAQRAGVLAPPVVPVVSEAAFQAAVIKLAKDCGYLVYFTKDSRRSPSGYPDLCCAKAGAPLILAELKTDVGACTKAQEAWLAALAGSTGVVAATWRPSQWSEIVTMLRGEEA
jgi:hypothetical protein